MRQFMGLIALSVLALVAQQSTADVLWFEEHFDGTDGQTFNAADTDWSNIGSDGRTGPDLSVIEVPTLTYDDLEVSDAAGRITQSRDSSGGNGTTRQASNSTNTMPALQQGERFYSTFVMRVDDAADFSNFDNDGNFVKGFVGFNVRGDGATNSSSFAFGFRKAQNNGALELFAGNTSNTNGGTSLGTVVIGQEYLFAVRVTSPLNTGAPGFTTAIVDYALDPDLDVEPVWTPLGFRGISTARCRSIAFRPAWRYPRCGATRRGVRERAFWWTRSESATRTRW